MMKVQMKFVFGAALAALMLTACSKPAAEASNQVADTSATAAMPAAAATSTDAAGAAADTAVAADTAPDAAPAIAEAAPATAGAAADVASAAAASAPTAGAVDAKAAEAMTKANGCLACHTLKSRLVGPSYQEVADKYRGDATAEAKLIKKVKDGGAGVWGQIPMIPHPGISDADLKTMVDWILSLPK